MEPTDVVLSCPWRCSHTQQLQVSAVRLGSNLHRTLLILVPDLPGQCSGIAESATGNGRIRSIKICFRISNEDVDRSIATDKFRRSGCKRNAFPWVNFAYNTAGSSSRVQLRLAIGKPST